MFNRVYLALVLLLLLTSCALNSPAIDTTPKIAPVVVDTACEWVTPIYISKADVLTDDTAKQILTLDKLWKARCGKPVP